MISDELGLPRTRQQILLFKFSYDMYNLDTNSLSFKLLLDTVFLKQSC